SPHDGSEAAEWNHPRGGGDPASLRSSPRDGSEAAEWNHPRGGGDPASLRSSPRDGSEAAEWNHPRGGGDPASLRSSPRDGGEAAERNHPRGGGDPASSYYNENDTMTILLIADHDNAALKAATLNAVTAAAKIGGDLHILVAGNDAGAAAQAAAQIPGVAKVLHADAPHFASPVAENVAATVVALAKSGGYSHVLAPATGLRK